MSWVGSRQEQQPREQPRWQLRERLACTGLVVAGGRLLAVVQAASGQRYGYS